ncbi:MAG: M14 family zinc carboxypeptidase, partial [Thermoflexales bacterium]|nr:M14 family zinc carboxypeptidase [Thermoflexales bacterium]
MRGKSLLLVAVCLCLGSVALSHGRAWLRAETAPAVFEFSVEATSPSDSARLGQTYDVVTRRGDVLVVLGDAQTQRKLEADGFIIRAVRPLPLPELAFGAQTYYGGYRTVAEMEAFMDSIAAARPDLATVITYGHSWRKANNRPNGHDLKAICLTRRRLQDCQLNPNTDKPRLLLIAAIHPRELSTSEMALRWIEFLVNDYSVHPDVTWLMDDHELWVIPVANPDGRWIVEQGSPTPYTQRKNANDTQGTCSVPPNDWSQHGVDLNRNASFQWLAQSNPCSLTYPGTAPASEPEQQALEALMAQLFHDQRGAGLNDAAPITSTGVMLTLHSYSDLILLPWGWVSCSTTTGCSPSQRAPNDAGLRALAFRMGYFTGYAIGQASELLYSARGTTDDWAYGVL